MFDSLIIWVISWLIKGQADRLIIISLFLGILDADSTTSSNKEDPGGDYSEPYESARGIARANDNQNEYQPIGEIEPRSENNNHKKLESVENSCYESLDNTKGNIATHGDTLGCTGDTLGCTGDYQQLTLPRGPSNGAGL